MTYNYEVFFKSKYFCFLFYISIIPFLNKNFKISTPTTWNTPSTLSCCLWHFPSLNWRNSPVLACRWLLLTNLSWASLSLPAPLLDSKIADATLQPPTHTHSLPNTNTLSWAEARGKCLQWGKEDWDLLQGVWKLCLRDEHKCYRLPQDLPSILLNCLPKVTSARCRW